MRSKKDKRHLYSTAWFLIMLLFVTIVPLYTLDFLNRDFNVLGTEGDGFSLLAYAKSLSENGFIGQFFASRLGAPEQASAFIDFPGMDILHSTILWLCTLVCKTPDAAVYMDYILTFLLAGGAMFFFLKFLHIKNMHCALASVLFSLMPAHFMRGIGHISVSQIFTIPLGLYVAFYILEEKKAKKANKIQIIALIISCILVGTGYQYYAFFMSITWITAYLIYVLKCHQKGEKSLKVDHCRGKVLPMLHQGRCGIVFNRRPKALACGKPPALGSGCDVQGGQP